MQFRSLLAHPGVPVSDATRHAPALDTRVPARLETATFASG
jgi:hypothetical protein